MEQLVTFCAPAAIAARTAVLAEFTQCRASLRLFPVSGKFVQVMKMPINMEETIGKTVGRRTEITDPFGHAMALQAIASELIKVTGRGLCPKGVFKFNTHEEADAWILKMMARPATKRI